MSRFEQRKQKRLRDPAVRSGYREADAEIRLIEALDAVRRELGMTQVQLATRLKRSQPAISQFFNVESGITVGRLIEYLDAMGLQLQAKLVKARDGDPPILVKRPD